MITPLPVGRTPSTSVVRLSQVVASLSYALDITEGQDEGHALRSCLIGMRMSEELQLDPVQRSDLFYALLLKDLGCSCNASDVSKFFDADDRIVKRRLKTVDWTRETESVRYLAQNVSPGTTAIRRTILIARRLFNAQAEGRRFIQMRCERGAQIAEVSGLSEVTAETIANLDEHFDGRGQPRGLEGHAIPLLARIAGLAQTAEVIQHVMGLESAAKIVRKRSGRWFDPELVNVFECVAEDSDFATMLSDGDTREEVMRHEPFDRTMFADDETLDRVTIGFAHVIDAKSPWTLRHSSGVAERALGIGKALGMGTASLRELRRGALLHDIGKLGVSNRVLDKAGPLTDDERSEMQRHTVYTAEILKRVAPFRSLAAWSSAHHERLDGSGYPHGLKGDQLSRETRILAVADVCQAITEKRPYRPAQPSHIALKILRTEADKKVCGKCVEALACHLCQMPDIATPHLF